MDHQRDEFNALRIKDGDPADPNWFHAQMQQLRSSVRGQNRTDEPACFLLPSGPDPADVAMADRVRAYANTEPDAIVLTIAPPENDDAATWIAPGWLRDLGDLRADDPSLKHWQKGQLVAAELGQRRTKLVLIDHADRLVIEPPGGGTPSVLGSGVKAIIHFFRDTVSRVNVVVFLGEMEPLKTVVSYDLWAQSRFTLLELAAGRHVVGRGWESPTYAWNKRNKPQVI